MLRYSINTRTLPTHNVYTYTCDHGREGSDGERYDDGGSGDRLGDGAREHVDADAEGRANAQGREVESRQAAGERGGALAGRPVDLPLASERPVQVVQVHPAVSM